MKTMYLKILFFSVSLLAISRCFAQEWELASTKEGITVLTRESIESPIKEFKASAQIEVSFDELLKIILDIDQYNQWYDHCKSATILNQQENSIVYHMEYQMPFPFSNRDVVSEMTISSNENEILILFNSINGVMSEQGDIVRMPIARGSWKLVKQAEDMTYVEHQYLGDPAGNVPGGVVNMFLVAGPIHTLSNLRERASLR